MKQQNCLTTTKLKQFGNQHADSISGSRANAHALKKKKKGQGHFPHECDNQRTKNWFCYLKCPSPKIFYFLNWNYTLWDKGFSIIFPKILDARLNLAYYERTIFLFPLSITFLNPKSLGFLFSTKNSLTWEAKCEKFNFRDS